MNVKRLKDEQGTSALEFAIIAPVFLFLVAGMLAYGVYFGAAHSVQQVAAEAARASIAGLDDDERTGLAQASAASAADGDGLLKSAYMKVDVRRDPDQPELYSVTVSYDASYLPIWDMGPPLPMPSSTIVKTSSIRAGGF